MHIAPSQRNETPRRAPRPPAPIGRLATLPVFLDLAGRRVVVIGGTDAAAWKAELLAAAGANVEVFATEFSHAMLGLLERGTENGRISQRCREWSPDCLVGAAVVVADAASENEILAIRRAAKAAGVPVNIIDRPAYCDFRFGSIVNRSPVVIGISTDGAAPILGQAIRRRIEALLPPWLSDWGAIAARLRATATALLDTGTQRRRFWEHLSERAFRGAPDGSTELQMIRQARRIASDSVPAGRATLVGIGPGDAEHLTLKAVRRLQSADVILFDDGVPADVLELARREAQRIAIGARTWPADERSADHNAITMALVREGKHVVRLVAGDPAQDSEIREDIAELMAGGFPVDVVPGIANASVAVWPRIDRNCPIDITPNDWAASPRRNVAQRKRSA